MKKLTVVLIISILSVSASAQKYNLGIGGRVGKFHSGLSLKFFSNTDNATGFQIEAMYANIASGGLVAKGFFIKQLPFKVPIIQLPLDLVLGAGAHVGFFPYASQGYYKIVDGEADFYKSAVLTLGVDATAQIEYKIPRVPITFTIDVTPFYEFVNKGPEIVDFGVSLRYVFK